METTNTLVYVIDRNDVINCKIVVKLHDDCKNGHEDFSVTATFWKPENAARNDHNMITGGACHEEIIKHFPELQQFADLHLSDFKGYPMHAVENGIYHLENSNDKFCQYYGISQDHKKRLEKAVDKYEYAFLLNSLGIVDMWNDNAKKAIEKLEELTGKKFEPKGKSKDGEHIDALHDDYMKRKKEGYYTPRAKELTIENAQLKERLKIVEDMLSDSMKKLNSELIEAELKIDVYNAGGLKAMRSYILYTHKKEVVFNWRDSQYDNIKKSHYDNFIPALKEKYPNLTFKFGK